MRPALLALALIAAPADAQKGPQILLNDGESIETELRVDLNGDGNPDLAYVAAAEDKRELRVVLSYVDEFSSGEWLMQVLSLDPYPLADAVLSAKTNRRGAVLTVAELTGGTTAVASTHRFRWDDRLGAMRLIGLDATLYSRTFAHDGQEASWNLLTGDLITRTLKLNSGQGDQAYNSVGETKTKKPSPPVTLQESPSGDDLLGWPGAN
jgi:hypothetical protein